MKIRMLALSLLACSSAFAVTVGHVQTGATAFFSSPTGVITSINTAYPAPESGTVSTVTLLWGNAPAGGCTNAFKVKFLRTTSPFGFTLVATRGPFNASNGSNTVTLSPSVSVIAGDMIGITQLYTCGGVSHAGSDDNIVGFTTQTDPSGGAVTGLNMTRGMVLAARASSAAEVVAGHLPLAAGGGGIGGTFQRTGLQLANFDATWISGKLVFHPMFASASPGDPSITYSIPPGQTISADDILSLMGVSSSGSMDIMVSSGAAPRATTRIYKDTGSGTGTLGDHEDLEHPQAALGFGDRATINTPTNLTNFQLNLGVRTFASGATISVYATNATGAIVVPAFNKVYPANYTEEVSASTFLGGFVPENGTVYISVTSGSLMTYGLVTDLLTTDTSFRRFTRK